MKAFTSTDLKQHVGDVLSAAAIGPVAITKHDKARFVLMTVEEYDRRHTGADPRQVYGVAETPDDLHDILMASLDRQLEELEND